MLMSPKKDVDGVKGNLAPCFVVVTELSALNIGASGDTGSSRARLKPVAEFRRICERFASEYTIQVRRSPLGGKLLSC
jgi:hypothetical protein